MESETFLNGLLEVINQPVFSKDENFKYTFCNQAFADYLGFSKEEIIGSDVFQLYDQANAEVYHQADIELFQTGGSQHYETLLQTKSRTGQTVIFHKSILTGPDGKKTGIIGFVEVITELKKKEKELSESESKYQKIFENVQDIFYRVDLNGIVQDISPSVSKYSDYTQQEIIGQPIDLFYANPEDRNALLREMQEKGEVLDFEIQLKGKNNDLTYASVNSHFISDEKGQIYGIEGALRDLTERKRADEKLKSSLSLIRAALDSTADGLLVIDQTGRITNYNKQFKAIFNVPDGILESGDDEAAIQSVLKLFKDPDLFLTKVMYLYSHPTLDSSDTLEFIDGRIIERYSCPQFLDGIPIGRVWSFRDVTEQKLAEKALKESEIKYRLLIENQGEGLTIVDPNEDMIFVNPAAEAIFGVKPGMLVGHNLREFISVEQFEKVLEETGKRAKNEKSTYELDIITPSGIKRNILVTATPQTNENGKYIGTFGVLRDITSRIQAEELLRQSEEKYRNLIETMPDGVYRSTHEGKFVEVNPAMVKMLGYASKEELLDIDIKSQLYFAPEDRESLILDTSSVGLEVFPMKKKDGSTVWIEDHGWYIRDNEGQIRFHEGILRDVTERKMIELQLHQYSKELQELNATKDKFFSIIAHDLKNPFNSITGLSEIMKNEAQYLDADTIEQYSDLIYNTSNNAFRLLENLLNWALMQQGKIPFIRKSLIINELVNDVFELLSVTAHNKNIRLINSIPENLIVHADANMIKTVIRNLVSNAIKYTSSEGIVEVSAISEGVSVQLAVTDNGTGIRQEDIEKLFQIGSDFSRRGTKNESGTGLGLILCKEFIEKHEGTIWVESEVGKGSKFKFRLPE